MKNKNEICGKCIHAKPNTQADFDFVCENHESERHSDWTVYDDEACEFYEPRT